MASNSAPTQLNRLPLVIVWLEQSSNCSWAVHISCTSSVSTVCSYRYCFLLRIIQCRDVAIQCRYAFLHPTIQTIACVIEKGHRKCSDGERMLDS